MTDFKPVKAFLSGPVGKILVTGVASVVLAGSLFESLSQGSSSWLLLAIAAFVVLMLAVPILIGWKRPRELAVAALVAMIVAAPITGVLYTQEIRAPVATLASPPQNGGSVLTDAGVTPHLGAPGQSFDFRATINPQFLPAGAHAPEYFVVYLSTCPGAQNTSANFCPAPYPFWELNQTFGTNVTNTTSVDLAKTLNLPSVWWWLAAFVYEDASNQSQWVWVGAAGGIFLIPGPVTEDYSSTFLAALPTLLETNVLYAGLVYYSALVIYMWLKTRESRRNPPVAGPAEPGDPGAARTGPPGKPAIERSCPTCGALVYPEEKACWKCGGALAFPPGTALPTTTPPSK